MMFSWRKRKRHNIFRKIFFAYFAKDKTFSAIKKMAAEEKDKAFAGGKSLYIIYKNFLRHRVVTWVGMDGL